ncbi:MAG: hypothetical protein QOC68_4714 [Solirubrobacteraceae bacterium]|nr:hypothetical protein [Solirubrobacteraceae bacterium]
MIAGFVVVAVLFEAALIASLTKVRLLWRGEPNPWDCRPIRSQRTTPALISSAAILLPLSLATGATGATEKATTLSTVLVAATLLYLCGAGTILVVIWTTGHPKALVPPHLRNAGHSH